MTPLPVVEAQERLLALAEPASAERAPLIQAGGRWLREDVRALRTQPSADLSSMDGYAIRHADLPGPWTVVGESAAGRPHAGALGDGEAARIFTGAAMPSGADTVLIQEEAARDSDAMRFSGSDAPLRGAYVRRRGLDFAEGDALIAAGARVTPARVALAAAAGHGALLVNRPVSVALLSTGDELAEPGEALAPHRLPDANRAMIAALLADLPVAIEDLGILPDRADALRDAFARVDADLLVTTGGASVGDHDLVRPALEAAGGAVDFWRVAMRPGKPLMAGRLGGTLVLGLPGNPVSAYVTALLFVRPLVAALAGAADPLPRMGTAILAADLPMNGPRADYVRAAREPDGRVRVADVQDSSMLLTLARSDCLIVRPAHAPPVKAGDSAEILELC